MNGENVENLTHREIVDRVKAVPNETTLLVVDDATYKYYFDRGIQVTWTEYGLGAVEPSM